MWFQHDEFPAHFSANVRSALDTAYPGRWIGLGGPMYWLTCSLDLLLPRLLPLGPYQESCLRKPRRLQRGPGCEDCRHSRRYPEDARGYLLMFDSPSIDGVRPASLLVDSLSSSFCDSARKLCVYHFLCVIIHSYALREYIKLFLFILSREVAHVYYEYFFKFCHPSLV
ncbi:UNVERIFIED_CONTAM: hypothetical protein NCL1_37224 [Trichonephila clavipes]